MAKDSGYWPTLDRPATAVTLMHYGAYTAGLSAVLTAGIGSAAIYLGHRILGMDGWVLADSALFAVIAWRVYCLSLPWAIAGLVIFALERIAGVVIHPSFGAILGQIAGAYLFGYFYLNAVRSGLYLRETKLVNENKRQAAAMAAAAGEAPATEASSGGEPAAEPRFSPDDHAEFLKYLQQNDRRFQRPGRSVQDEFAAWMVDRAKKAGKKQVQEVGARG